MSDETKPTAVRAAENDQGPPHPAIVKSLDGEEWAVDNVERREHYLRLINYEADDCGDVREVVDLPHSRVEAVQYYPLAEDQTDLLQQSDPLVADGGADDLEERVVDLERKMEHVTAHNRRDTAPEGDW